MKMRTRFGLAATGALAALVFAGQALAAYAPKLTASTTAAGTTIGYVQVPTDDPTAVLTFFVPTGYTANLTAAAGTNIGTVDAKTAAADLGGAILPLGGSVQVRAADGTYLSSGAQVPLAGAATVCTGSAAHSAFWVLVLTAAGQTLEVPLYVDQVPVGNPIGAFASYTMTLCLPPPDVPPGTPGRAAFGAKLLEATFSVKGILTKPAGETRWRLRATPYTPAAGKANPAGTVESQSLDRGPATAALSAKAAGKKKASVVVGFFTSGTPSPIGGAKVQILAGKKVIATGKTNSGGQFKATVTLPAATATLVAVVTAAARDLGAGACLATFAPLPCIGATVAPFSATSKPVKVKT